MRLASLWYSSYPPCPAVKSSVQACTRSMSAKPPWLNARTRFNVAAAWR